ncbi:GH12385 [Drosophila grimshawi]|uniref:trypsin n=1 Tax=Drosophila grimshawi TaxID=7222 RepID=B4JIV5_DROGR|nr:GH12385 [Drosophila grimshawi]
MTGNCVEAKQLTARVGSINQFAGGDLVDICEVVIHASYGNFLHDLAIITLCEPLTFGEKINKIALPAPIEEGEVEEVPTNGTPVYVAGWGEQTDGTSNYKLQKANFNTLGKGPCELDAGYGYDSTLCLARAEKQGVCRGDDGAAVVDDDNVIQGVVSFFWGDCGTKYPDVSTRIVHYLAWIEANKK